MGTETESVFASASTRKKLIVTFAVYSGNFVMGMAFNFLGPTLTHFKNKYGDDNVDKLSIIFSVQTGSYVIGSFAYLISAKLFGRHPSAIVFLIAMSVPMFFFPYIDVELRWLFHVLGAIVGFGVGGYDPAQVAWIIDIWRDKAGPFIIAEHFAYSVGTVFPSIILGPFLSDEEEDATTGGTTTTTTTTTLNSTLVEDTDRIYVPFSIAGGLGLLSVVIQVALFIYLRNGRKKVEPSTKTIVDPSPMQGSAEQKLEEEPTVVLQGLGHETGRKGVHLLILTCIFIGAYQGMEMDNLAFLPTFARYSDAKVSESYAADVTTGCTAAFATGRLIGILLVLKIAAEYILTGNFVLMLSGTLVLFFMGSSRVLLWIGSILLGFGFSTVYPGYFAYIEKHLFISDLRAAMITICGGTVAFVYPFIVGNSIETNPRIMSYVSFLSLLVVLLSFSTIYYLTTIKKNKKQIVE